MEGGGCASPENRDARSATIIDEIGRKSEEGEAGERRRMRGEERGGDGGGGRGSGCVEEKRWEWIRG